MTASPVPGVTLKTTKANNIHMRYAEAAPKEPGGPLVLFAHGWPESWYSWRHQLQALSAAGFRAVAPDMRGYGGTEAPEPIDQYTLFHMVGDMAELQQDIRSALRRLYFTASGDMRDKDKGFGRLPGGTLLGNTVDPEKLPAWLGEADLDYYAGEFARTGFRGGLNWYRNLRRNWELGGPWRGQPIRQPSLFIAGSRDGVLRFPAAKSQLEAYPTTLPGLRGCHILEGAGHWVQQEQPAEVNKLLIDFLKGL
jgi:pimeloyl-ACP methyl ester carboxylesterase